MTALEDHAAATAPLPWHLRNNWAPVHDELTVTDLRIDGAVPPELDGVYLRTGPNPHSGQSDHWFFGDGMVHGIRLSGGTAEWYRNRYVQTPNITDPIGGDPMASMGDLTRGTGNTHVMAHQDKILCLEEGHWPWRIDNELNTLGYENFGGALTTSMTAHPKVCPVTGDLIAFSYLSPEPPFLHYIRIGADGQLKQLEGIEIPNMVMMHDFNVTRNHVIFMDLPVCFDLDALATGMPFKFKREAGARLGVMPRTGTNADVRWFEIDPCYVFHPVNAHEDGNTIVLHVSRQPEAFGSSNDDYAEVGRLWKWTIDLTAGTVREEQIDDRPGDFGRVDDRLVGLDARYGYLMAMAGEGVAEEPVYGSALWKYDLRSGQCWEHQLGDGVRGAEPVFAPASPDAGEDEGWVISLSHDTNSDESRLLIIDAQNFSAPPVATIHLPRRVPYGAHGSWVADRD
jgi:carotenoid cleavage dioxygenase-like enzyme